MITKNIEGTTMSNGENVGPASHQIREGHVGALQREVHPRQPAASAQLEHPLPFEFAPGVELRVALHVAHQDHARIPDCRTQVVRGWVLQMIRWFHTPVVVLP